MSFDAIRWALDQPVKSATKLVLVVMAECVNSDAGNDLSWPSYRFIAKRAGIDQKTVEAAVYRLREGGYITDTGTRRGETSKVVVYQLNTTKNGGVTTGPEGEGGRLPQHANGTKNGGVKSDGNDPEIPGNPPKSPAESPQISCTTTPKTGSRSRKGISNGTRKEAGGACARPDDVSEQTWADWTALRAKKRTTASATAIGEARKEAAIAGLTLERFLVIWCLRGSQGLEASWLKPEEKRMPSNQSEPAWRREQRERTQTAAPGVAVRDQPADEFFDSQTIDAPVRRLN